MSVFDAHLHILDPSYPLVRNHGHLPHPFTVDDYLARVQGMGIEGGAVVSGSFQAFDQRYLVAALEKLGPRYVGVTQLPVIATDRQIMALHEAGVRAVRFNMARSGTASLEHLERLAWRVYELAGWHAEFYLDARELDELGPWIAALPVAVVDHLGMHGDGLHHLLRLVDRGVKVKATGFGRVELDPAHAMRQIMRVNPTALMVGTDLPSTMARRPFRHSDFDLIRDALEPGQVDAVFWRNAAAFYLFDDRRDELPRRRK